MIYVDRMQALAVLMIIRMAVGMWFLIVVMMMAHINYLFLNYLLFNYRLNNQLLWLVA